MILSTLTVYYVYFTEINGTTSNPLTWEQLQQILSMAVNEGQLGNFSAIVNGQVISVSVAEPITVDDPLWATINPSTLGGYRVLVQVDHLAFHQTITENQENLPFVVQPKIKVMDAYVSHFYKIQSKCL